MVNVRLRVENIGGFRKPFSLEFNRGRMYFVEGSNSSGKTSLIKALAGVLSVPPSGQFRLKSARGILEAEHLGIKSSEKNPQEGLVNAHANFGEILLEIDGNNYTYQVRKDGKPVITPKNGNELFLLTSVLSNDSRILRQLNDGIDDFSWIVDDLSLAKRYSECVDILKTKKEDFERMYIMSTRKKGERRDLEKKLGTLRDTLSSVENEMKQMESKNEKIKDRIKDLKEKREEKHSEIEEKKNSAREIERSLTILFEEHERRKTEITKGEEILKSYQEEHAAIPEIADMERALEKLVRNVQESVTNLQTQRERKQGVLDLCLPALNSLRKMDLQQIECPLCETGAIDATKITERIEASRKDIDSINGKIKQLLMEKDYEIKECDKKRERKAFLLEEIRKKQDEVKRLYEKIRIFPSRIAGEKDLLKKTREEIMELEREYEELKKTTEVIDEEISKKLNAKEKEKSKINEEMGAVKMKLEETSLQIADKKVNPERAEMVLSRMMKMLEFSIQFFSKAANEHRREAARKFNQNISKMVQKLGFEELVTVRLNDEYRLYVERVGESKEGNVIQQVKSLSTSEKLTIALILQSALRNTYLSEIPFFLIDGLIEDFDVDRRKEVINYLKQLTAEENIIVIATKLNEELPSIEIQEV